MQREEENEAIAQISKIPISIQVEGVIVDAMSLGDVTWVIHEAWVENMSNQRVTELAFKQEFRPKVRVTVSWPNKPWYITGWVLGVTAVGGGIQVYDNTATQPSVTSINNLTIVLDNPSPPRMPDVDKLVLKITGWANESSLAWYSPPPWN